MQAGAGFGAPCALPVNAGDAEMKGVEVETTIRPIDGWLIDASAAYLDFDYKKFASFATPTGTVSVGGPTNINAPQFGDYPAFTPRWKWSVGTQYEIVLPGSGGSLTPRLDIAYQGHMNTNPINRDSNLIDEYVLGNARLTGVTRQYLDGARIHTCSTVLYLSITTIAVAGLHQLPARRTREWAVTS